MSVYRVSWFDTARICPTCQAEEEAHPDHARDVELTAVARGDLNFPGVGLSRMVAIQNANTLQGYIRARGLDLPADPILP